ncbi:hypothetical protein R0131_17040 [Clostridium sp. AL.422]|uniref:hypothetical protein n=1 Tax=Clostridium TaxID=1485 RepID=UPI00293DB6C9|nr:MULTISPECIES: hypothetical protein [unclassified Clostridium]MDV4152536.1 hypothetical protein [Clostridium sp. AL.422]
MKIERKGELSSYSMEEKGNFFVVSGKGLFKAEDAKNYIKDFKDITRQLPTRTMELVINTFELKTSFQDVNELIGEMTELYRSTPFLKKHMVMPVAKTALMQIKRQDPTGFLDTLNFVSDLNELIK